MVYNLSLAGANATGYLNLVQGVNSNILNNMFGIILIVVAFAIIMISFISNGFEVKRSLVGATFTTFLLSIFLVIIELAPVSAMITLFVLFLFAIGWSTLKI